MSGDFSQTLPAELLATIHSRQQSGTLVLRREGTERKLLFDNGCLISASSTAEQDDFGELLIRIGRISPSQLDQAKRQSKPGAHLAQTLLEMKILEGDLLKEFIELQVREILYPVLEWTAGEYSFKAGPVTVDDRFHLKLSLPSLIFEGIRRISNLEAVYRGLKGNDTLIRLSDHYEARASEAGLDSEEAFILSRVEACSRISEVLQISPLGLEKTQKTLYALVATGIIELGTEKSKTKTPTGAGVSQAYRTFHSESASPKVATPEPSDKIAGERELEALKLEIFSMLDNLKSKNYYDLLNVPSNASLDEIKKSYYALAKQFHPDRYAQFTEPDVKGALESIFSSLAQAYDTLKVPATRASYDAKAFRAEPKEGVSTEKPGTTPVETPGVSHQKLSELNFRQGRGYYDQQDYWSAIQAFRQCVRLEPEVGRFRYWLAMALSKNPRWRREAEEHFHKAIELEQFKPAYYVGLGMLYRDVGMVKRAESQFKLALQFSPEDTVATQALKEMAAAQKKQSKGLRSLARLFKKK